MAFKYTSDTFQISASAQETVVNTAFTSTINLNLDSLSREILVVQYVDLDITTPDILPNTTTKMQCSLNNANVGIVGLANPQGIAIASNSIVAGLAGDAVSFQNSEPRNGQQAADIPLFISATDDLFLTVKGTANAAVLGLAQVRIFARRARADADTYAAILTAQFNS